MLAPKRSDLGFQIADPAVCRLELCGQLPLTLLSSCNVAVGLLKFGLSPVELKLGLEVHLNPFALADSRVTDSCLESLDQQLIRSPGIRSASQDQVDLETSSQNGGPAVDKVGVFRCVALEDLTGGLAFSQLPFWSSI